MKRLYLVATLITLALFSSKTNAQVTINNNDTTICAGHSVSLSAYTGTKITLNDDVYSQVIPIGFSFTFFGNTYTQCLISSNGYISFNIANAGQFSNWATQALGTIPGNTGCFNSICGVYQDLVANGGSSLTYITTGTAPNRKFIVTFCDWQLANCNNSGTSFQIILYETTNVIDVQIGKKPFCNWQNNTATEGIQNANGTVGIAVPGRNGANWTVNNDGQRFTPQGASYFVLPIPFAYEQVGTGPITWYAGTTALGNSNPITVTPATSTLYTVKQTITVCDGSNVTYQDSVNVFVNPSPTLSSSLTPPGVCSGSPFSYVPTSTSSPVTFSWTRALVTGISNAAASGTGNINETLINTTNNTISVPYTYVLAGTACNDTQTVTATVYPTPTLSSPLIAPSICTGSTLNYTATSATPGTTFSWTRAAVSGITNPAGSGSTAVISEALVNSTTSDIVVTYVYTLTANGCTNTQNVTDTVKAGPTFTSSTTPPAVCSGTPFSYTPTSSTPGATFSWTRAGVTGISNPANAGVGSINETLINTTNSPITVTYVYTVSVAGSCSSTVSVNVVVNPAPAMVSTTTPPAVCSNTPFSYSPASTIVGTSFTWTRAVVAGISNPAGSGAGNINETLINTTANPVTVTYVYTMTSPTPVCSSTQNITVVINPTPTLSSALIAPSICSGTTLVYTPTSATVGTTFSWTRAVVAGISNGAGAGVGNINETLTNTTASPVIVTYVYTLTANGCTNTQNVTDTVLTTPIFTSATILPTVCSGTPINYTPTSNIGGATFTWTRAAVGGIANPPGAGTGSISETLTNSTVSPVVVTYVYHLTYNTCTLTQNVTDTILAVPALSSSQNPPATCSGSPFIYTATSFSAGTTFSWVRNPVSGISNPGASGTGNINETLINTTTGNVVVTYAYTLTANGCTNPTTFFVAETIKPIPSLSSSLTPPDVCSGNPFTYTPTSATTGAFFTWTRAVVAGISNGAGAGFGNINETLNNTTTNPIAVTYNYTINANGCNRTQSVVVNVNPSPTFTSPTNAGTVCSGNLFTYTPTSSAATPTYTWTRAVVVGISNPAGAGTGDINETLTNTTSSPVVVTYVVTVNDGTCSSSQNVTVTVNPAATLSSSLTPPSICSGATFNYTPTSTTAGATFSWARLAVVGISNPVASGNGSVSEALVNTTAFPVSVTYNYTITANGCTNTQDVVVIVKPAPTLSSTLTPPNICTGSLFSYTPTSATAGASFTWTRAVVAGVTNPANAGGNSINEVLTLSVPFIRTVTYVYTITAAGCTGTQNVTVNVSPLPVLTSTTNPPSICSGTPFSYNPTSSLAGTTYTWTRAAVPGISNPSASGSGNPLEVLFNVTAANQTAVYAFTLNANGCINPAPFNVNAVVKPSPTLSSPLTASVCSGSLFSYTPTSATVVGVFNWTRPTIVGITNPGTFGTGTVNETLVNTTTNPIDVPYTFTFTANGCTNSQNVVLTVNPQPVLTSSVGPFSSCSGNPFTYTPTSSTAGATFNWTRLAVAGISNPAASGTGSINETLINTTSTDVIVSYDITTALGTCASGTVYTVKDTVFASPTLTVPTTTNACSGVLLDYPLASQSSTATFSWTRAAVVGISNPAGSGIGNIKDTLFNTTPNPVVVTYVVTVNSGTCTNVQNVDVTVNPLPTLTSTLTPPAICSGNTFNYTPTSASVGATFDWTRAVVSGISNVAGAGSGDPNEVLTNTTTGPIDVTYIYTLSLNGCTNDDTVVVTVNPTPSLTSTLTPADICSGTTFNYTPTSATTGTTFDWTRAAVAGISNAAGAGSGDPNEVLINTTAAPIAVTYVYTLTANGCTNTQNVVVTVNPSATLSSPLTASICNNATFNYTPTSPTTGVVFTWTRAAVAGITQPASSGSGNISEVLTNTTTTVMLVTYVYTLTAFGCSNTQNVVVTVNPTPVLTSTLTPAAICSGSNFVYNCTSATPGVTYSWTRAAVAGITPATGSGNNGNINEILTNTTTNAITVTYAIVLTINGCTNTQNVTVSVKPKPALTSPLTMTALCPSPTTWPVSYTPTSGVAGTNFTWTRALVAGVTPLTSAGVNSINESLISTNTTNTTVTYAYTLTANGCTNTQNVTVVLKPKPTLSSLTNAGTVCSNVAFSYSATSLVAGTTYSWTRAAVAGITPTTGSGANGNINETLISTNTTATTVTYVFTLTANGCTNTQNVTLTVNPAPNAVITANTATSFCQGGSVVLVANGGIGLTYQWKLNGNPIAGATNSTYTANSPGTYTVTETNTFGCSTTSNAIVVTVLAPPPATVTPAGPVSLCTGGNVLLTANTGAGLTYQWKLYGVNIIGATGSTYNATVAGDYTVVVTNAGGCSTTSAVVTITLTTPPPAVITQSGPAVFCATLYANTGLGLTYQWQFNGTNIIGATNSSLSVSQTGTYRVIVSNAAGAGCSTTSNAITVTVTPPVIYGLNSYCQGDSFTLHANILNYTYSYQWQRNNVNIPGATEWSYTGTQPGTYRVVITDNVNGCSGTSNQITVQPPLPTPIAVANAVGSTSVCIGGTVTLNANTGTGLSYQWLLNGSTIAGATSSTYIATQAGDYSVIVSNANGCYSTSNVVTLTTSTPPQNIAIIPMTPVTFCQGGSATLQVNPANASYTYQWQNGTTNIAGATGSTYQPTAAGTYRVKATDANGCFGFSNAITVTVNPAPTPVISQSGSNLVTGTNFSTYQWYFGTTAISGANSAVLTKANSGTYVVTVTDSNGCQGSSTAFVYVAQSVHTVAGNSPLRLYPNPTSSILFVDTKDAVNIKVADLTGRILLEQNNENFIDVSTLSNGIYMVSIYSKDGVLLQVDRIMKQ